jgi:hypothetical protein
MIFLIEYNRSKSRKIIFKKFKDSDRSKAEKERLKLDLDLNRKGIDHEVVLLEAASEAALRRTHQRYFEDARQIVTSATESERIKPL